MAVKSVKQGETQMYEVLPATGQDKWRLHNTLRKADVVSGISREGCIRLKRQLEVNLGVRRAQMQAHKESRHEW